MANNNGGPWGGGGGRNGGDDRGSGGGGGRRPGQGDNPQIPEIDEIMKKGQEQLRVLMGGRGGGSRDGGGGSGGPRFTKGTIGLGLLAVVGLWLFTSFYTVRPEEQSVELFLGKYYSTGEPGLNFAPWPLVTAEVIPVTENRNEQLGFGGGYDHNLVFRYPRGSEPSTGDEVVPKAVPHIEWRGE